VQPGRRAARRRSRRRNYVPFVTGGLAFVLAIVLAVMLWPDSPGSVPKAAGSPDELAATPEPTQPPPEGEVPMDGRGPLSGVLTEADLGHASVTVKVSNTPDAHPHRGLNDADIVFVEPITGWTTRLAVMFHSTFPEHAGPTRSLRPMDAPIIGPTGGVLANTSAQQWVIDYIDAEADVANLSTLRVPKGIYFIDESRVAPNHVFTQPTLMLEQTDRTEPPEPYFRYSYHVPTSSAVTNGSPATSVTVEYGGTSTASWTYDAAAEHWLRAEQRDEGMAGHVLEDGEQVRATNVVVLVAERDFGFAQAGDDMTVLDVIDTSGAFYAFTGGSVIEGTWSKAGVNDSFEFVTADGEPLLLAPGTTWVEMPLDTMNVVVG
jgi:hypothetical protein